jgi:hypothetical protein
LNEAIAQSVPDIAINEVMASNSSTIADDDGDFSDWIELYNTTNQSINLEGYGLSDNFNNTFKWVLPDITMAPGSFLLIWASGKNRRDPNSPLHTNFAIAADGEEILLSRPDETRVDALPPTSIPIDFSFGRFPNGSNNWFLFDEPTPGSSNKEADNQGVLTPPTFSHESGFYTSSFNLTITHEDPQVQIIYTLDGSEPELNNLQGTVYNHMYQYLSPNKQLLEFSYITNIFEQTNPIPIRDRTTDSNYFSRMQSAVETRAEPFFFPRDDIFKGTVVRARAVKNGSVFSAISTHTYFVTPEGRDRFSLPVVSIAVQEDDFFDYEKGIYVPGKIFDDLNLDTVLGDSEANYNQRGIEWERKASMMLFETESANADYRNDLGVRIHGGFSRAFPMKSLRLYARNEYGDNRFRHQIFPDEPYSEYNRLILRNGGNDWDGALIRDPLLRSIVKHMNFDTQAYRPFILFLNGEYWGVHGMRERFDEFYLERKHGVVTESIDLLTRNAVVVSGSNDHYLETLNYIRQNGLTSDDHYKYIQTRIDVENFIDYLIAHIFVANLDWPGNNVDFWRKRTAKYEPFSPPMHDGRWRWLVYDMDYGFHRYSDCAETGNNICAPVDHNSLEMATGDDPSWFNNPPWSTELFRALLTNGQFRIKFANRYLDQLNTAFLPSRTVNLVNEIAADVEPEMNEHLERWFSGRDDLNFDNWKDRINSRLIPFAEQRPGYARTHLKEYFNVENEYTLTVDLSNQAGGYVQLNTVQIRGETPGVSANPYPWTGTYFEGVPITLSALPEVGYQFSHWEVDGEQVNSNNITLTLEVDVQIRAFFEEAVTTPVADLDLIHYFLFSDDLPNNTPLTSIKSTYSGGKIAEIHFESNLVGYPFDVNHPNWRIGSMERRNQPSPINYRPEGNNNQVYEDFIGMRALQIKQPFEVDGQESALILKMPTVGFDSVVMSFAAMNENAGVDGLVIDYSVQFEIDSQSDTTFIWTDEELSDGDKYKSLVDGTYQLYTVDFSEITGITNNPNFRVRVRFDARSASLSEGNQVTFNNITLDGNLLPGLQDKMVNFILERNYPNPFHSTTTIPFTILESGQARLEIFNTLGQRVALLLDDTIQEGSYQIPFDGLNLASGVYLYRLYVEGQIQSRMMVLIK